MLLIAYRQWHIIQIKIFEWSCNTFHFHNCLIGDILVSCSSLSCHPLFVNIIRRYYHYSSPLETLEGASLTLLSTRVYVGLENWENWHEVFIIDANKLAFYRWWWHRSGCHSSPMLGQYNSKHLLCHVHFVMEMVFMFRCLI